VGLTYLDLLAQSAAGIVLLGPPTIGIVLTFLYIGTRMRSERWQLRLNTIWNAVAIAIVTAESHGVLPKQALAHGLGTFAYSLGSLAILAAMAGAPPISQNSARGSFGIRVSISERLRSQLGMVMLATVFAIALPIYIVADEAIQDGAAIRQGYASRFALGGLDLATWGGEIATVRWTSSTQQPSKPVTGDCLIYLGQTDQQIVLYDVSAHQALRVPLAQVMVSTDSDRTRC
jgi:hypothetical protein